MGAACYSVATHIALDLGAPSDAWLVAAGQLRLGDYLLQMTVTITL
jgi:hypothetical protein